MGGARRLGGAAAVAAAVALAGGPPSEAMRRVTAPSATELTVTGVPRVVLFGNTAPQPLGGGADVNGDGNDDVIVGSPAESPRGRRDAGAAYVVSGGTVRRTVDVRRLGSMGFRLDGAPPSLPVELDDEGPAGGQAGAAVAGLGDVNGDGLDDVAVGAPYSSAGGRPLAGAVHVVFGRRGTAPGDLGLEDGSGYRIDGADPSGRLGTYVAAAGDTNGDGLADVLVAGKRGAWIAYGQRDARPVDLAAPRVGAVAIRPERQRNDDGDAPEQFPVAGAGDVNGDGLADVVVGAPDVTPRNRYRSGAAYVVYGRRGPGQVELDRLGGGGFRIDGEDDSGSAGTAVAPAGDVNGDRLADVLIGAPDLGADGSDESDDHGAAYIVLGTRTPRRVDLDRPRGAAWRIGGNLEVDGQVGSGLAALGDVDGDGLGDVAVGAPGWDGDCRSDTGAVFVVRGRRTPASIRLDGPGPGVHRIDGSRDGAGIGRSLAPITRAGARGAAVLSGNNPASSKGPPAPPSVLDTRLPRRARAAIPPGRCLRPTLLTRRRAAILKTGRLRVRLGAARPRPGAPFQVAVYGAVGRRGDVVVLGLKVGRLHGRRTEVSLRLTRSGRRLLGRRGHPIAIVEAHVAIGDDDVRPAYSQVRLR